MVVAFKLEGSSDEGKTPLGPGGSFPDGAGGSDLESSRSLCDKV